MNLVLSVSTFEYRSEKSAPIVGSLGSSGQFTIPE